MPFCLCLPEHFMKKYLIPILSCIFVLSPFVCFAQQNKIDSLQKNLRTTKEDTSKVNTLNILVKLLWQTGNYDTAKKYADDAFSISDKINFKKGKAASLSNIGLVYWKQGKYPEALKYYFSALKIAEETGDKRKTAAIYTNIGNIYINQENYSDALKNQLPALDLARELGDKKLMANAYNSIATIYYRQGNFPTLSQAVRDSLFDKSLKNHFAALNLNEETGNKNWLAYNYNNIGILYESQGEAIRRLNGNKDSIEKKFSEARQMYFDALKIEKEIDDKDGMVGSYLNLGSVNTNLKIYSVAQKCLADALLLSKEIENMDDIKDSYLYLQKLDSTMGDYNSAYKNYKMYIIYRDSLLNEENTKKTVQTQMQYEFDKKETKTKTEQEKKDVVAAAEMRRQKIILLSVLCGFLLVVLFSIFIFRSYSQIKKKNIEITHQKKVIEEKQKEILDSIHYAARIQRCILPTEKYIAQNITRLKARRKIDK